MDDPAPAPVPPWFHFGIRLDSAGDVRDTLVAMQAAGVPIVKPAVRGRHVRVAPLRQPRCACDRGVLGTLKATA
jgi:catechol 2,3-dioxygenase-like lactoylglutathione lyase family enzyme